MQTLLAAYGSKRANKALASAGNHESLVNSSDKLFVANVQPKVPVQVKSMLGSEVAARHREEGDMMLDPFKKLLDKPALEDHCASVVGHPVEEILRVAKDEKSHLIVMDTRGHRLIMRASIGSNAQRVMSGSHMPELLM